MSLFEEAVEGNYDYYHLLSGVDLPLKPAKEIADFFEAHQGKLFLSYVKDETPSRLKWTRLCTNYYHFMRLSHLPVVGPICAFFHVNRLLAYAQQILGVSRMAKDNFHIYKGANWVSIPKDAVDFLLSKKDFIYSRFHHTCCCDEIYKHTVLLNSPFRERLYEPEMPHQTASLRLIGWDNPIRMTWTMAEKDELLASNNLFARKFSTKVDEDIVDLINSRI